MLFNMTKINVHRVKLGYETLAAADKPLLEGLLDGLRLEIKSVNYVISFWCCVTQMPFKRSSLSCENAITLIY